MWKSVSLHRLNLSICLRKVFCRSGSWSHLVRRGLGLGSESGLGSGLGLGLESGVGSGLGLGLESGLGLALALGVGSGAWRHPQPSTSMGDTREI